jgi:hypothetical protein
MATVKEKPSAVRLKEKEITPEMIQEEAYYQWLERGCPLGDDLTDWVAAERKLAAQGDWIHKKN